VAPVVFSRGARHQDSPSTSIGELAKKHQTGFHPLKIAPRLIEVAVHVPGEVEEIRGPNPIHELGELAAIQKVGAVPPDHAVDLLAGS
jgi:hypothetical protein